MKFLADECCDAGVVAIRRAAGHDVRYILETHRGAEDLTVAALAAAEERILPTEDKDFGEFMMRRHGLGAGIVLLRLDPAQRHRKGPRLLTLIERFGRRLAGHHTVVEADRFCFRPISRSGQ
ncbi:MAG: DUF5615 family PIN-like protein [Pseudomonadota bacterium]